MYKRQEERPRIDYDDDENCILILIDLPYLEGEGTETKYVTFPMGIVLHDSCIVTVSLREAQMLDWFERGMVKDFYTQYHTRFALQVLLAGAKSYLKLLRFIDKAIEGAEHQPVSYTHLDVYKRQRLQADHMDYKFTKMDIKDSVIESLEDFRGIIEEKNIKIENELISFKITSDEKILKFILSQIISNAVKYTSQDNGIIKLKSYISGEPESKIHLSIKDNGSGVPKQDLPFIFDKGFTGTHPNRQSATGIGLYLVKKYTEMLNIEVEVDPLSTKGNGFEIVLKFPVV